MSAEGDAIVHEGTAPTRPIRVVADYDLHRPRLIVFFRILLALPHLVWLYLWRYIALLLGFVNWLVTLFAGRSPEFLQTFLGTYIRYSIHVQAFVFGAAKPFPGFTGEPASYPIDVQIDPARPQSRWKTFFRLLLAIPAFFVESAVGFIGGVAALLGWFVALVTGRMPAGLEHAMVYSLNFQAQTGAYTYLLTDRYPCSDPGLVRVPADVPAPAVELRVTGDLRRSRLTVFFRALLALPHLVWMYVWAVLALLATLVGWLFAIFAGRLPRGIHRFVGAYLRYSTHVTAFLTLVANPFPGFVPSDDRPYPVDLAIAGPEKQRRAKVFFRFFLAIPALLLSLAYGSALFTVALLGWFASLFTGRMPGGLRDLGAAAQAFSARYMAYAFLLTDRYPYTGPLL